MVSEEVVLVVSIEWEISREIRREVRGQRDRDEKTSTRHPDQVK